MKKIFVILLWMSLAIAASAQDGVRSKRVQGNEEMQVKQRVIAQWDAWTKLDFDKAGTFYAKDANNVYFDIAPLKYTGWAEYRKGAAELLSVYKSLKGTYNDDLTVRVHGNLAWVTGTIHATATRKDGKPDDVMDMRVTSIWEKRQGQWMDIHEHVSVAMQ